MAWLVECLTGKDGDWGRFWDYFWFGDHPLAMLVKLT
jgi:hypothetical protein